MGNTKAGVGCDKFVTWSRVEGSTLTYGTAKDLSERVIAVDYKENIAKAELYASNKLADSAKAKTGAEGSATLTYLDDDDRVALFGETQDGDTNVSKITDVFPYVACAYRTNNSDGTVNVYKMLKVAFKPDSEKAETKEKDSVKYATTTLNYEALPEGECIRYACRGLSLTTDADFIEDWFTTADFVKKTSAG